MPTIKLDNLTQEQQLIVNIVLFEGMLRAYEEILQELEKERAFSASEDPHYGYYIKHVIDMVQAKYDSMKDQVEEKN
jgi:hypothetical protein